MQVSDLAARLNADYPGRNWSQQCQRLVWNVIDILAGGVAVTYPTATAARLASAIVSTDAGAAPVGAIHYWQYPADGHVGVSLGGGAVLMTDIPSPRNGVGYWLGTGYGVTTVHEYTSRKGNPYLGWARSNGKNPSLIGKLDTGGSSGGTEVIHYKKQDKNARANGRIIAPGKSIYLHESIDNPAHATNVVGGKGNYSITPHVYAVGEPGDRIVLKLRWQYDPKNSTARTSDHYEQTLTLDADGQLKDTREFKGYVGDPKLPVAVYVHVAAHTANRGDVKITLLDCDSYLFA